MHLRSGDFLRISVRLRCSRHPHQRPRFGSLARTRPRALLPKLEPLIEEFKEERDAAFATWMRDALAKWKATK